jgi:unsaturated rhamnogalacturonyl hydrolase
VARAPLSELVDRVADYSLAHHDDQPFLGMDVADHDWEKGVLVNGLLACGVRVADAKHHVERSIETQTGEGQFAYGSLHTKHLDWDVDWGEQDRLGYTSIADPLIPGHGVLEFYDRTGDDYYLDAARKQYEFLQRVERVAGVGIPQRREAQELWVDMLYMAAPFLARYGVLADDPDAVDDAVAQFHACRDRLRDPETGLYRHNWAAEPDSFVQSTFWARGNGWVLAALADVLAVLPADHAAREDLVEQFEALAAAMRPYQDASGFWHNIVDDRTSWLETSGTLMATYAFGRGVDLGVLDPETYVPPARQAMEVCEGVVDSRGRVRRVAKVPGGPKAPAGVTLHGQGWFLLAAAAAP